MKKIVITCGLICGILVSTFMAISMSFYASGSSSENGMMVGYASMILAFSLIFVAIKNFRDKNGGTITFGNAFTIGLFIALIASTMYVATWAVEYNYFFPDFMDKYTAPMLAKAEKTGDAIKIAQTKAEVQKWKDAYDNPVTFTLYTYLEILPVGILVSLIAAAILQRRTPKTSAQPAI